MEFTIEKIPVWAVCYLINGTTDNLSDEDKAIIDKWWEQNNVVTVSPATDEEGAAIRISAISQLLDLAQT